MLLSQWHPRQFLAALRAIDEEISIGDRPRASRKVAIVLATMALCLLGIHYLKYASVFDGLLRDVSLQLDQTLGAYSQLRASPWFNLQTQAWWAFWHLLGYVLVPVLVIRLVLKERLSAYGIGWGETTRYLPYYLALALPIVFFAFLASFREDFANHYPFYPLASRSLVDLLLWELLYIAQFVALEFFFRGFVLHACKPSMGSAAVFVMCVPYLMIHFPKPWLEATGAIPFGILLGVLALRSRSIWGGAAVHVTIALSMDILALAQGNRLPVRWLP